MATTKPRRDDAAPRAPRVSRLRILLIAALVSAVTIGLHLWRVGGTAGTGASASASPSNPNTFGPAVVSEERIRGLPDELGHPVYWAGPRDGTSYELTIATAGQVGIRYLDKGTTDTATRVLTIATAPRPEAYQDARTALKTPGGTSTTTPSGSLVFQDPAAPSVGYLVKEGMPFIVTVFAPGTTTTWGLLTGDEVVPISR